MTTKAQLEVMKALGIDVAQDPWELSQFLDLIGARRPRSIIEVGTRDGGTLWMIAQTLPTDGHVVSVDLVGGPWGRANSGRKRAALAELLRIQGRRVDLIDGRSTSPDVIDRVRELMPADGFDVVFIDADHTEAGVRGDWEFYGPLCAQGGVVAFHDIRSRRIGVWKLWDELKARHEHLEIHRRFGIGVLFV